MKFKSHFSQRTINSAPICLVLKYKGWTGKGCRNYIIIHLHDITDHSAHLVNVGTQKSLQEKYPQESFNIFYSQMAVQPNIKETIVFLIFVKNNESWKEIFSHVGH